MAITKIHAIKSTLGKALAYIENPDKTDGQMLVSGYNCEPQTASIDFEMTAVLAHKARNLKRKRSTNLAYHLIQSFSPEDAVTPEQAHELGKKLAFEYTGGKYEYVVATHIDKGHIFCIICFPMRSDPCWYRCAVQEPAQKLLCRPWETVP